MGKRVKSRKTGRDLRSDEPKSPQDFKRQYSILKQHSQAAAGGQKALASILRNVSL